MFKIESWKVSSQQKNGELSESIIFGNINGRTLSATSSVKGGPVDALYRALKNTVINFIRNRRSEANQL